MGIREYESTRMNSLHLGSAFSLSDYHVVETGLIAAIHWSVGPPGPPCLSSIYFYSFLLLTKLLRRYGLDQLTDTIPTSPTSDHPNRHLEQRIPRYFCTASATATSAILAVYLGYGGYYFTQTITPFSL